VKSIESLRPLVKLKKAISHPQRLAKGCAWRFSIRVPTILDHLQIHPFLPPTTKLLRPSKKNLTTSQPALSILNTLCILSKAICTFCMSHSVLRHLDGIAARVF
jgi:hypothetical protein